MGPRNAATAFLSSVEALHPASFRVTLYGSLAATGRGHLTDKAILDVLAPIAHTDIVWKPDTVLPFHTNAMSFEALDANCKPLCPMRTMYSIGGGEVIEEGQSLDPANSRDIYEMDTIGQILQWCEATGHSFWEYVEQCEGPDIWEYLGNVWDVMVEAVRRGIEAEGVLPGGLGVRRKAVSYYVHAAGYTSSLKSRGLVYAYALAVSEENAAGGRVVTAPTMGSAGILPSVLRYFERFASHTLSADAAHGSLIFLTTAAAICSLYRTNASISGAEVGCQGEVGVACSMAAAGLTAAMRGSNDQIEQAAEIAIEHNLGLTCDPVNGLVQIPCIERNAMGAVKAVNAARLSLRGDGKHIVSLDEAVKTMYDTGKDMSNRYKETSLGGLAVNIANC